MKTKTLDSTKIYWLDKEETVKVKLVGLDMPHGFGSAKYTFRVLFGGAGDIVYMDSNLPKTIHEIVERNNWSFTTPIAMKCTEEQFNGIEDKLAEMGYILYGITFGEKYRYLSSNFDNDVRCITDLAIGSKYFKECSPIIFQSFNPDLFLALAAMTDKEDGIKGEWWKCGDKFWIQTSENYANCNVNAGWLKATAQEIIEHFEKKEFVLPKFWHVVVTEENVDVLSKWRFGEEYPKYKLNIGYIVGFSSWQNSKQHNPSDSRGGFGSEITSDQFKKYVLKEAKQSCQIIPIPPTKQATIFDDRVEITDWEPKEGDFVFYVAYWNNEFRYTNTFYNDDFKKEFKNGFIKRTESEAKQLVEKLKQAML